VRLKKVTVATSFGTVVRQDDDLYVDQVDIAREGSRARSAGPTGW
jgi:hypothetical protein